MYTSIADAEYLAVTEACRIEIRQLSETLAYLEDRGAFCAIVGGVALSAWLGVPFESVRSNGSIRDVDIVVLEDPNCEVEQFAQNREKLYNRGLLKVPVDFNFAKPETYRNPLQLLTHFKRYKQGLYGFVFRNIEAIATEEVFKIYKARLLFTSDEGVIFSSFQPITLLHLYIHRVGSLKRKDQKKVRQAARMLKGKGVLSVVCHSHYRAFHNFGRAIRARYPWYHTLMRAYNYIDNIFVGSLSVAIPRRLFRYLVEI